MNDTETHPGLIIEDRLKAIVYQFVALYERWSEDRQIAAKQGAEIAELVTVFTNQVKEFKALEPKVRQHLTSSIENAIFDAAQKIGTVISKEATRTTEQIARRLLDVTHRTEETLTRYQKETIMTGWKVIGAAIISTIAASLLIVWLLIPKPTYMLPLTDEQMRVLTSGRLLYMVWPKLSKQEQDHLLKLTNQAIHP
jgi:hypothetical protein